MYADRVSSAYRVPWSKELLLPGWACLVPLTALTIGRYFGFFELDEDGASFLPHMYIFSAAMFLTGVYLLLTYWRKRIVVDDSGIVITGILPSTRTQIEWLDVEEIIPTLGVGPFASRNVAWKIKTSEGKEYNLPTPSIELSREFLGKIPLQQLPGGSLIRSERRPRSYQGNIHGHQDPALVLSGAWLLGILDALLVALSIAMFLATRRSKPSGTFFFQWLHMGSWQVILISGLQYVRGVRTPLKVDADGIEWQVAGQTRQISWSEVVYASVDVGEKGGSVIIFSKQYCFASTISSELAAVFMAAIPFYAPEEARGLFHTSPKLERQKGKDRFEYYGS